MESGAVQQLATARLARVGSLKRHLHGAEGRNRSPSPRHHDSPMARTRLVARRHT